MRTGRLVVAVTGASGAIYAQRLLMRAAKAFDQIYLAISRQGIQVAAQELGISLNPQTFETEAWLGERFDNIRLLQSDDYFTPPASGSFRHDGMVIVPCSMGTAGRIANGISDDLVTRAADVCLKEKRKLIVVPREMPWNAIQLRNLTKLSEAGAIVLPASPAWYTRPTSLEELADTVVARILQALNVEHDLMKEWMS